MRIILSIMAISGLLIPRPDQAEANPLVDFGTGLCWTAITNGIDGTDADYFRTQVQLHELDQVTYCGCVGQAFAHNAGTQGELIAAARTADEEATAMATILSENLSACLPDADSEDVGLSPFDPDYDLSEDMPEEEGAEGFDPQDVDACFQVILGDFPARDFDAGDVRRLISQRGLETGEICTCTARWMVGQGDALQDAIANAPAPGAEWGTALGRGIQACLGT